MVYFLRGPAVLHGGKLDIFVQALDEGEGATSAGKTADDGGRELTSYPLAAAGRLTSPGIVGVPVLGKSKGLLDAMFQVLWRRTAA